MKLDSLQELEQKATQLRKDMLQIYGKAGIGHITSGLSCMDFLVALYYGGILKYDPINPQWEERDIFLMSKGHGSTALFPVLADLGFFSRDLLDSCTLDGSEFGLCLNGNIPGTEATTGSLAIGFGMAAGIAKAKKMNRKYEIVVTMLGDGECYEGAVWETALFAGANHLNNLIAVVDRNHLCITDFTENLIPLEPYDDKWKAFGWDVKHIDGHNIKEILDAFKNVHSYPRKNPLVIIGDTIKGNGVDFIENRPLMHGIAVTGKELKKALEELDEGH